MTHRHGKLFFGAGLLYAALLVFGTARADAAVILSDNLSAASAGVETAQGATWLAASFGTGTDAWLLASVSLLLSNSVAGTATLSLYSDGGLEPGSSLGTLTSPTTYSSTLANTVFTGGGITLTANTTYWIVLRALTGQFDWSWTLNNTGSGAGFQGTWGISSNAGVDWFSSDIYPTQFSVSADAVSAIPEPGTLGVLAGAFTVLGGIQCFRRR